MKTFQERFFRRNFSKLGGLKTSANKSKPITGQGSVSSSGPKSGFLRLFGIKIGKNNAKTRKNRGIY